MSDNVQSIQFLRGIAAFFVLLCHSVMNGYFPEHTILYEVFCQGYIGVHIFFIISGFILPYSMYRKDYQLGDFFSFFAKRIARIEPPYIVSIALVLFLNYVNTITPWYTGPSFTIDWPNVFGHLGYLNTFTRWPWLNWAYWTLAIEFQYYIIIALVYPLITHKNKAVLLTTFYALMACFFIHPASVWVLPFKPFDTVAPPTSDSAMQILPFLPFFLTGIALFLLKVKKITLPELLVALLCSFTLFYYRYGLVVFSISVVTVLCISYIKKVPDPLMFLGTISYSLYLVHDIIVSRFEALLQRYTHFPLLVWWVLSLIGCILAAYIYYILIEKPFLKLSKRIKFNHQEKGKGHLPQVSAVSDANE